jgi:hypothetical protein
MIHTERSMSLRRSALVLLSLLLTFILGCQPAPKPVAAPLPPPASEEDASSIQSELLQRDPDARTGLVTLVRSADSLAAVTLTAPAEGKKAAPLKVGDTFTFIDSKQEPLANGHIVSIEGDLLVVSYEQAPEGRMPREGDIAIHLSSK